MTDDIQVRRIGADEVDKRLERPADILIDCVATASRSAFLPPLTRRRALAYWRHVADAVVCNQCVLLDCGTWYRSDCWHNPHGTCRV